MKNSRPVPGGAEESTYVFRASGKDRQGQGGQDENTDMSFPERPGERIDSVEYNKILTTMDRGEYSKALSRIDDLINQYPAGSREREVLNYMEAECLFFQKNMESALVAYRLFLEQYPDSPMVENARAVIDFISSIDRYKKLYVSPLKDQPGGRRR